MTNGLRWLFCLLAASLLSAGPALARKVPRAAQGETAFLVTTIAPEGSQWKLAPDASPIELAFTPAKLVLLEGSILERRGDKRLPAVPTGRILYGHQLDSGLAFCEPLDLAETFPIGQCAWDVDGDGRFDAAYWIDSVRARSRYLPEVVRGLTALPGKAAYRPLPADPQMAVPGRLTFRKLTQTGARFALEIEGDKLESESECVPDTAVSKECTMVGLTWRIDNVNGEWILTLVSSGPPEEFTVAMYGRLRNKRDIER